MMPRVPSVPALERTCLGPPGCAGSLLGPFPAPSPGLMPSEDLPALLHFSGLQVPHKPGRGCFSGPSHLVPNHRLVLLLQPPESSLHLSGASPAEFWQEAALCSGANARLGRARTGIRPPSWLLPAACYVSSGLLCVTFWYPGVLKTKPTKQPVLGLAILTSSIRDLCSSLFVVIWFPVH